MENVVYNNIVNVMIKKYSDLKVMVITFLGTILFFITITLWAYKTEPAFRANNNNEFIENVEKCINFLERSIAIEKRIDKRLIITKASLESNFGKSRFAIEGNNLFGIKQFENLENGMLPEKVPSTVKWRVASFKSKCDSVRYYIHLLNSNVHYEEFRKERDFQRNNNISITTRYFVKLEKYATNPDYPQLLLKTYKDIYEIKS